MSQYIIQNENTEASQAPGLKVRHKGLVFLCSMVSRRLLNFSGCIPLEVLWGAVLSAGWLLSCSSCTVALQIFSPVVDDNASADMFSTQLNLLVMSYFCTLSIVEVFDSIDAMYTSPLKVSCYALFNNIL